MCGPGVAKKSPERRGKMTWECSSSSWGGNLCESAAELSCGLLLPAPPAWCLQAAFDIGVSNFHESSNFCHYDSVALGEISASAFEGSAAKHAAFQFSERSEKNGTQGCEMQRASCQGTEQSSIRSSPTQDASTLKESRDSDSSDSTIVSSSIVTVHAEWKEEILTPIPRKKSPILKIPCGLQSARPEIIASKIKLVKASMITPKRSFVPASIPEASNSGKYGRHILYDCLVLTLAKLLYGWMADTKSVDKILGNRSRDCTVKVEPDDDKQKTASNELGSTIEVLHHGTAGETGTLEVETSVRGRRRPVLNFVDLHNGIRSDFMFRIVLNATI